MSDKPYLEEEIEIPGSAFVPCPRTGDFSLVSIAKHCTGCDYWQGLYQVETRGQKQVPFKKQYSVKCIHPVSREIVEVNI